MTNAKKPARLTFVLAAVALGCATWIAGIAIMPRTSVPSVTWRFGSERSAIESFDVVPAWEAMTLSISLPFDAYVYVVSFDHLHGAVTYFPTEYLGTDLHDPTKGPMNFLARGEHVLPGPWNGSSSEWFVPNIQTCLSLCVVASRQPIAGLEAVLPFTRQVGNRAYRDESMGFFMPRAGRDKVVGTKRMPHRILQAAMDNADAPLPGPMLAWPEQEGVYLDTLHLVPGKAHDGSVAPNNPFSAQLDKTVQDKLSSK